MNKSKALRSVWIGSVAIGALMASPQSFAQDEEDTAPRSGGIEEIFVEARYVQESVQEVPQAITAVDDVQLEKMVALDLEDIGPITPNLHIQPVATFSNSAAIHIRGMGIQGIESTEEPRVGISVDGVFFTRPVATLFDLFDVQRIEVLRGPQGITFGKNSLAGGLNVTTKRPSGEFGYQAELTYGNYGRSDFRGALDLPLVDDKVLLRMSVLDQNYDGHFTNRVDGSDLNGEDVITGRATLVLKPIDILDITIIGTIVDDDSDAPGGDSASDPLQVLPAIFGFTEPDDGPFTVGRDAPAYAKLQQQGVTGIAELDLGAFSITSISAFYDTDDQTANDYDQSEVVFFPTTRDQVHEQFSQELRLNWSTDLMDSVFGLYYLGQEHQIVQNFPTLGPSADYTSQQSESRAVFGQVIGHLTESLDVTLGVRYTEEEKEFLRHPGLAGFAPFTGITTNPATHLSTTQMAEFVSALAAANDPAVLRGELKTSRTTFKAGADYKLTPEILTYALFSQGFRAGSFGARATSLLSAGPTEDETSDNYEIGFKSDWLDNRLRVNVSAFHTIYENLQFSLFVPAPANPTGQETAEQNVAEVVADGFEIELTAAPTDRLTFQASLGYLNAQYEDFCADIDGPSGSVAPPTSTCGSVTSLGDIIGPLPYFSPAPDGTPDYLVDTDNKNLPVSRAPEIQFYVSAEYVHPMPNNLGEISAFAAANYESEYNTTGTGHPKGQTGDWWVLDGSLAWTDQNDRFQVRVWGKNLTDEVITYALTPTAQYFNQRFYSPPRTYGVTLTVRG